MDPITTEIVVDRIIHNYPRNADDLLEECQLPLLFLGSGSYRNTYHILGTNLVVKVPRQVSVEVGEEVLEPSHEENVAHAREEVRAIRKVKRDKNLKALRPYMPTLHHHDRRTGLVVMDRYDHVDEAVYDARSEEFEKIFDLARTVTGVLDCDLNQYNMGLDVEGNIKLIDLGCLTGQFE